MFSKTEICKLPRNLRFLEVMPSYRWAVLTLCKMPGIVASK